MAIGSTDYPHPVQVNGFTCRNCADVDKAKKHIDPEHPRSGPYGIDAATDPTNPKRFLLTDNRRPGDPAGTESRVPGYLLDIRA